MGPCRFFFSSRRRHRRLVSDWSSDVCSSDLPPGRGPQSPASGDRREASFPGSAEAAPHADRLMPAIVDRAVEAVVSDLPDPTIVLTPESMVVAFNESAQEITPGILRGEPISFALRVPNVLEAVRAVAASREMRRIEFFQRVPTDRWWEATIAPLVLPGGAGPDSHLG